MQQASRARHLVENAPFFQAAGAAAMTEILRPSFAQLLPRGTTLFEQGDEPDFVHMLLEGSVGLQAAAEGDGRTMVEFFGPGELFLAPAVMLHLPYLASAVALTEVRVLMIPADVFRDGVSRSHALCRATTQLLARHWRLMVDQVVDLKLRSAEDRVARFVARRVSEEAGAGNALLPEPRSAIAARLGMTPETLSRALGRLERKGCLQRGAGGATVADRTALTT
ncbi:cyclic nucleotide-binding domain-containing protein [Roseomonas sp. CECT 9278]|uniref:cyclic nucleotide-binding domain-containing protein n=1 Tax=Roseomonas sp. CECT 9278 TaxID=2845823 RepID=UPI001E51E995|nr:cyclic nucleotide-binding domain-containing protein [Roseomonas sp. CECT 9278]CAH0285946.1 CRP-like cAMP-activated global transcriptional regulator [Roseomonas sp. CECT 9278]